MKRDFAINQLKDFYKRHTRMPSYTEMAKLFHYSSRGATYYLVDQLVKEGIIERDEKGKLLPKDLLNIPILGIIKAGYPIPADVQHGDHLNLHTLFSDVPSNAFALQVSGDSMIDAGINEGDFVIVSDKNEAKNGDVVAACVDGDWSVKYFQKNEDGVTLLPANELYNPIIPKESLTIGGVVVNVIRKY